MKKILLLLALTFMVGAVNAKTDKFACNTTLSPDNSYSTYSGDVYSWTTTSNKMWIFNDLSVDFAHYKHLRINISEISEGASFSVNIYGGGDYSTEAWHQDFTGSVDIDLTEISLTENGKNYTYSQIKRIAIKGTSSTGNFTMKKININLESDEYEAMEISTPIAELYWYDYSTGDAYDRTTGGLKKQLNTTVAGNNQIIYGPYSAGDHTAYMNVTGYDNALFTLNTAGTPGIRLMYNGSTLTIDTDGTKTSYTQSLSTMPKIGTIKTKNGSGDVSFNIASINFAKKFKATSETAFNIAASSASTVNYDRTFVKGRKSTVCLPFALNSTEVEAAGTFYELKSAADGTLTFSEVTETEAYKPYVFEAKKEKPFASLTNKAIEASADATTSYTVGDYTFQGVLAHQSLPSGVYGYNAANGVFSKTTSDKVTIDAFRAYITTTSGLGARAIRCVFGNEITGIDEVKSQKKVEDDVLYNLSGQRVSPNHKGFVIKTGRKYIMK